MEEGKTYDRLVGNWDSKDKMFYFLVQKWNEKEEHYETVGTFQSKNADLRK